MAFDAFLKISGVTGESTDSMHKDWIEVLSYSWGVHQPKSVVSSAGSLSAERADFHDFSVTKVLDKASPKLAVACASGEHFSDVTFEICRAGGDKVKYMEYKLTDVLITSCRPGGHSQAAEVLPIEEVTMSYGKIEMTYHQTDKATGKAQGAVAANYDLKLNKKG
ncbi:MAG TPA: type VI secretion system tube protein Hcp [Blastocatellia bacterium]|nr:type VI secretion system tube protein Hcp [Blastocatellia bacterium]